MSRHSHPLLAILVLLAVPVQLVAQQSRIRVNSAEELPRHTYAVTGSGTELVQDQAKFAAFAMHLAADLRADLAKYEIADRSTLKEYYGTLRSLALIDGRYDVALAYADSVRSIEDKPALKALANARERALVAAARLPAAEREAAFRSAYRAEINAVPWDVAQAELKARRGNMELSSPGIVLGVVQSQVDPAARSGAISRELANLVVDARTYLQVIQPLQHDMVEVLGEVIAAHTTTKPEIWSARDVSLAGKPGLTPVAIGIWDTGSDVSLFGDRIFTNPKEVPGNGVDDDGNGFVDDVHGIAYDLHGAHTTGVLFPLTYGPQEEAKFRGYLKGFMDIQAGVDSRDASELRRAASQLRKEDYTPFFEGLGQYGNYAHGTHVAGIAVAGNPAARVLDKACVDLVYAADPQRSAPLRQRIESRNGVHVLDQAAVQGLGSLTYDLISIDT